MVRIVVYGGLWEPMGDMHGLRPFIQSIADAAGYTAEYRHYDDASPIESADTLILIGHSYGGWQAVKMAGRLPSVDLLIALDPVYQNGENPDELEVFEVPMSVKSARCWWRGHVFRMEVSWPLLEETGRDIVNAQRPDIDHSGWAHNAEVRQGIVQAIVEAVAASGPAV